MDLKNKHSTDRLVAHRSAGKTPEPIARLNVRPRGSNSRRMFQPIEWLIWSERLGAKLLGTLYCCRLAITLAIVAAQGLEWEVDPFLALMHSDQPATTGGNAGA